MAKPTNLVKRKGIWYFRARIHGKRYWRSTGFHDLERARRRARELEADIRAGDFGWTRVCPTVASWWETYSQAYSPKKRAPHRDGQLSAAFVARYSGVRLDQIRRSDCEQWVNHRRTAKSDRTKRPYAPGTVRREVGFLKSFFQKAVEDGLLKANPWKGVRAPADIPRERVLSVSEELALRATLRPDYDRLLTVILGTGIREGELLGLKPSDVSATHLWVTGKFGKSRRIPLRSDVKKALEGQQSGAGAYWTQDPSSLRQALREACARAKVRPHVTIHDLRRTFASRCAAAGMPPKMLQELLGHTDISVTMKHYVSVDSADMQRTLESMPLGTKAGTSTPKVAEFRRKT